MKIFDLQWPLVKWSKKKEKCCNFFRNVLCGMLHCRHLNERLEFGMESVAILSHSFINLKGLIVPCRTAIVDLGINQVDPGLAPDGAKCGEGKVSYPYLTHQVKHFQSSSLVKLFRFFIFLLFSSPIHSSIPPLL